MITGGTGRIESSLWNETFRTFTKIGSKTLKPVFPSKTAEKTPKNLYFCHETLTILDT